MHAYGIFKARRGAGTHAQVVCHPPIDASNIPRRHVSRPAGTVGCGNLQGLERLFVSARSFESERHELSVAEGSWYPNVSCRSVDLPEEAVAVPRHAAAVMDGNGGAAGKNP